MLIRFQTAFRIALSITIAYYISLSLNWESPHWAAFSIAFCSLATVGESLLKGLLRTFGTFAAIFVALFLLAVFPQDRWIFTLSVSLWVSFCTWMMFGNARWYFWFCAGLGVPILSMMSGGDSLGAFQIVVLRAQQTILGTLVFTLVTNFVFASNSRVAFEGDFDQQVAAIQKAFFTARDALTAKTADTDTLADVLRATALLQKGLMAKLDAAALDSFDIAETMAGWRHAVTAVGGLGDALERSRLGLPELDGTQPVYSFNGLEAGLDEISRRIEATADLLAGRDMDPEPRAIELILDPSRADKMPAFQRAALSQTCSQLIEIDRLSRNLLIAVADVRGISTISDLPAVLLSRSSWLPDPERAAGTARVFTAFWLTFLTYIYVPDVPSWVVLFAMTTAVSMLMMMAPTLPLKGLAKPVFLSILFGGGLHILIMPHLSGFPALGLTIFAATFGICWICHNPQQAMGRSLGLVFFAVLTQIENSQTYSFTFVANLTVAVALVLGILAVVAYFPVSFRPERVFFRLLRRYCHSAEALLETLHLDKRVQNTWYEHQRRTYHANQMATIPGRMAMWSKVLPRAALSPEGRGHVQHFIACLAMLGDRSRDLIEKRATNPSEVWVSEVLDDARAWRLAIQAILAQIAIAPEELEPDGLRERLFIRMNRLEAQVADAIGQGRTVDASADESEAIFRELGGFRGVSEALTTMIDQTSAIDWRQLREVRL
jgi:uncharacterized membrane protein YccC